MQRKVACNVWNFLGNFLEIGREKRGRGCPRPLFEIVRCPGKGESAAQNQRFENWKLLRALALPYFLRSTTRLSRVRKPALLTELRNSGSNLERA